MGNCIQLLKVLWYTWYLIPGTTYSTYPQRDITPLGYSWINKVYLFKIAILQSSVPIFNNLVLLCNSAVLQNGKKNENIFFNFILPIRRRKIFLKKLLLPKLLIRFSLYDLRLIKNYKNLFRPKALFLSPFHTSRGNIISSKTGFKTIDCIVLKLKRVGSRGGNALPYQSRRSCVLVFSSTQLHQQLQSRFWFNGM